MSSITAEYVIVNCQDRAKYRRKDDEKVTGFAMTTTEEYPEIDAETLKTEILVPHISREGKKRIKEVFSDEQGIGVKFDYIKREDAEKSIFSQEKPSQYHQVNRLQELQYQIYQYHIKILIY